MYTGRENFIKFITIYRHLLRYYVTTEIFYTFYVSLAIPNPKTSGWRENNVNTEIFCFSHVRSDNINFSYWRIPF